MAGNIMNTNAMAEVHKAWHTFSERLNALQRNTTKHAEGKLLETPSIQRNKMEMDGLLTGKIDEHIVGDQRENVCHGKDTNGTHYQ